MASLRLLLLLLLCLPGSGCTSDQSPKEVPSLRVMTFNIRYNNPDDGENAWPNRKAWVAEIVSTQRTDLVGMQEALRGQIDDLEGLVEGYRWIGVGRDDGMNGGEFSPIFYREARFELLKEATFWLSETPDSVASRGWDAALPRIVTWGYFKDRETKQTFYLFNTHFDHRGEQARTESARLLVRQIASIAGTEPVLVTGDFNFTDASEGYRSLVEADALSDTRQVTRTPPTGPSFTFSSFYVGQNQDRRIDYLFVKNGLTVQQHAVLGDNRDGRYPSDHLPVLAEVTFDTN